MGPNSLDLGQFRPPEELGPPAGLDRELYEWAYENGAETEDEALEMIQGTSE